MAILKTMNPTLADVAARTDGSGKIITDLVELLQESNDLLTDMTFVEANEQTSHRTVIRTGLPEATWRKLYQGVDPSKSKTVAVRDTVGMLEAYAEVDKALADLNGNSAEWRLSEERAFIESMNQEMAEAVWYSDSAATPEQFMGLSPRYSKLSAENGRNIIDAGGTANDNTSIWLLVWGRNTLHGIYPKGSSAGLKKQDLGEVTLHDENNKPFQGYRSHYKWDMGLTLRDWRSVVRIANIDVPALERGTGAADLLKLMARALHRCYGLKLGRPVFYANRAVLEALDIQSMEKSTLALKTHELEGKFWTSFRGVPLRISDALLSTEARVQ